MPSVAAGPAVGWFGPYRFIGARSTSRIDVPLCGIGTTRAGRKGLYPSQRCGAIGFPALYRCGAHDHPDQAGQIDTGLGPEPYHSDPEAGDPSRRTQSTVRGVAMGDLLGTAMLEHGAWPCIGASTPQPLDLSCVMPIEEGL